MQITNYRSVAANVTLELGSSDADARLIVLSGLNGSGKKNVLDALRFVGDALRGGVESAFRDRGGAEAIARTGSDRWSIELELDLDNERWTWGFGKAAPWPGFHEWCFGVPLAEAPEWEIRLADRARALRATDPRAGRTEAHRSFFLDEMRGGRGTRDGYWSASLAPPAVLSLVERARKRDDGDDGAVREPVSATRYRALCDALSGIAAYSLFPPELRAPQTPSSRRPLDATAVNWTSVLAEVLAEPTDRLEFLAGLRALVPDLVDARVVTAGGYEVPEFLHTTGSTPGGTWRGARHESDGSLRAAALLVALLQRPRLALLGIEEPELAIHVAGLRVLWDFIEERSHDTQIVLTTHSTDVLDLVPPGAIRVVELTEAGSIVAPIEQPQLNLLRARLTTAGALQRSQGLLGEANGG